MEKLIDKKFIKPFNGNDGQESYIFEFDFAVSGRAQAFVKDKEAKDWVVGNSYNVEFTPNGNYLQKVKMIRENKFGGGGGGNPKAAEYALKGTILTCLTQLVISGHVDKKDLLAGAKKAYLELKDI